MTLISTSDLVWMRAQVAQTLPDTAIIKAVTTVSDGAGGRTPTWAAVTGGTVSCRIDPLGSSAAADAVIASQEAITTHYQLTVPHDAPIAQNNQVEINSDVYEVVSLYEDHSWRVSRRAIVSIIR